MSNTTEFQFTVNNNIASAAASLAEWKVRLDKDPVYAFEWSDDAMRAAAKHRVWLEIKTWADNPKVTVAMIREELTKHCMRAARYPERSTSVQSNAMRETLTSVRAEALEQLGFINEK